jgi:hypothetical protein
MFLHPSAAIVLARRAELRDTGRTPIQVPTPR